MRVAIAAAILGTALVASPSSQTSGPRPSDSLERPFVQNGKIRMDLSAAEYVISGGKDNRIQVGWSIRDAALLAKVHARVGVRGSEATVAADGPSNNSGLRFTIQVPAQSDLVVRLTAGTSHRGRPRQQGRRDHAGDASPSTSAARGLQPRRRLGVGRRSPRRAVQRDQGRPVPFVRVERPRPVSSAREAEGGRLAAVFERRSIIRGCRKRPASSRHSRRCARC